MCAGAAGEWCGFESGAPAAWVDLRGEPRVITLAETSRLRRGLSSSRTSAGSQAARSGPTSARMEAPLESVKVRSTRSSVEITSPRKMSWVGTTKRPSVRALRKSASIEPQHNRLWITPLHRMGELFERKVIGGARGLVSRVLFLVPKAQATVISLGRASPPASNSQPGRTWTRAAPRVPPYLAFLRVGFADPPPSPGALVRSYRTVSPLPSTGRTRSIRRSTLCCTFPGLAVGCR